MEDTKTKEETLDQIFEDLDINIGEDHVLLIWNDEVNDMFHVVMSLVEVCQISSESAFKIMMDTHNNGKSVVKKDIESVLLKMKKGLNDRGIEATVEKG